ncbi:MAG: class I SAM-dependent methyltransferase [Bacteroides sp.]
MNNSWNEQYSREEYRYGETPNLFFKEFIDALPVGQILLPGDGEGRNGVYAASKGWQVHAFDQSAVAREKALRLARKKGVHLQFEVLDFKNLDGYYADSSYDLIVLTFVHLPKQLRKSYFKKLLPLLKEGGYLILEGFTKNQIRHQQVNPSAGGPSHIDMLYAREEIEDTFKSLELISLQELEVHLSEGVGHQGLSSVLRYVGRK